VAIISASNLKLPERKKEANYLIIPRLRSPKIIRYIAIK